MWVVYVNGERYAEFPDADRDKAQQLVLRLREGGDDSHGPFPDVSLVEVGDDD